MNSLSVLIYLSYLLLIFGFIAGIVAFLFLAFIVFITLGMAVEDGKNEVDKDVIKKLYKIGFAGLIIFSLVSIAIPDQKTMYLIAASEASETLVKSPEVQQIFKNLDHITEENQQSE